MTIDFGIDLGTTNSSVAVLRDTGVEVINNQDGSVLTPSAVWYNKNGSLRVGAEAKARFVDDPDNAATEFKLRMGEPARKEFKRVGKTMLPEELSAEVLKSLKSDVHVGLGEDLRAAVITVPAAFDEPQCSATTRAARLAGLEVSPLLQEPVAAAMAYGFQSSISRAFWLVFDFGGGTFDAAVIQVRDGLIQVVNHAGDNFLGGKNIDWDIVDKLLVPKLAAERTLPDFDRRNVKWRAAFGKLKNAAEKAKIAVSRTRKPTLIEIDYLCNNADGDPIDFTSEVNPNEIQRLIDPWTTQAVSLCKRALSEKGLSGHDLEKIILVGGSSLFPWLQEKIREEIGSAIDHSIDPLTVVARGAAIFAGTQKLDTATKATKAAGFTIMLEYEPVGSDTNPTIGGRVFHPKVESFNGFTIEVSEERSKWRSGVHRLTEIGTFLTEILAEKGRRNEYVIRLMDPQGTVLQCTPGGFTYTVGMVITSPPLPHSIGIAQANNKLDLLLRKGQGLPAKTPAVKHKCAVALRKGEPASKGNTIRIPFVEGEHESKADRNRLIGYLEIRPDDPRVKRDIPYGSDVEIVVEIDTSRVIRVKAYVPVLDEEFDDLFKSHYEPKSPQSLADEFREEHERLTSCLVKAADLEVTKALQEVERLEQAQIVDVVDRQVRAAQSDADARGEAEKKLLDMRAAVDYIEDILELPQSIEAAQQQLMNTREIVTQYGTSREKEYFRIMERDLSVAIQHDAIEVIRAKQDELWSLGSVIVQRQPWFWIEYLEYLKSRKEAYSDAALAKRLLAQSAAAVQSNDIEALKAVIRQLIGLLPQDEQSEAQERGRFAGTTIRH